jgi:flagellar biosynthesis protein FlhA
VAQIPALLLSVAVAILVTRVSRPHDMSQQIMAQVLGSPALGSRRHPDAARHHSGHAERRVPEHGGGLCAAGAYFLSKRRAAQAAAAAAARPRDPRSEQRELSWDDVEPVDLIGLEVGYRLIPLVDRAQGGELMGRIKGVRKKLSEELGFLVQAVHIRDNLELGPNAYRITLLGCAGGRVGGLPRPGTRHQSRPGLRHAARVSRPRTRPSAWRRSGSRSRGASRRRRSATPWSTPAA